MKSIFSFLICSVLLGAQANAMGPIVISGTGNPAAVLCDQVKGESVIVKYGNQQSTLCAIGKGMVEQWTLFNALVNQSSEQATEALMNSSSCESAGGVIVNGQRKDNGAEISLCEFSDGSEIELETLQAGAQAKQNQRLIKLLLQVKE